MTSVSASHIILKPTQTVGSVLPQQELNPGPPKQGSRALTTEQPRPQHVSLKHYPTIYAWHEQGIEISPCTGCRLTSDLDINRDKDMPCQVDSRYRSSL